MLVRQWQLRKGAGCGLPEAPRACERCRAGDATARSHDQVMIGCFQVMAMMARQAPSFASRLAPALLPHEAYGCGLLPSSPAACWPPDDAM